MRKEERLSSVVTLTAVAFFALSTLPVFTQTVDMPSDVYTFPIQPGTPQWYAMPADRRMAALQLPDAARTALSTAGLLETCLRYPPHLLFPAFSMSADPGQRGAVAGLERLFNGFTELLSRRDAARILLARYRKTDVDREVRASADPEMWAQQKIEILEALLGDPRMLRQLSQDESRVLLCETLRKSRGTLAKSRVPIGESTRRLAEAVVRHLAPNRLGPPDKFLPALPNVLDEARALLASGGPSCGEE
jgi:hypothetical protein